jgi:hypothetical protein
LGQKQVRNPDHLLVRCEGIIAPIVDPKIFARAQTIMADRYVSIPDEQMLARLRITLAKKGRLTSSIINNTPGLPSASSYIKHFGSLRKAFDLIGYRSPRDCDWIDTREYWSKILTDHATRIARILGTDSPRRDSEDGIKLPLQRRRTLTLIVARQLKREPHHSEQWKVCRRRLPPGLLAIVRLDRTNKAIKDYVLMPTPKVRGAYLWLSDASLARRNAVRLESSDRLACAVHYRICTKLRR